VSWELIEHTGDIGVSARAPSLEALYAECARAMFSILAENASPAPSGSDGFPVSGSDPAEELRDFLSELLYRFSAERKLYGSFAPGKGMVHGTWEPYDPARHPLKTELKAVTWHQLEAVREEEGWRAQVIFDL
jgi:SHS2 domain-containing protein